MANASLIALSRQMALRRELDVVSNNVANINTTGYKGDTAVFEEYLMPTARHDSFPGKHSKLSYVHDRATSHDLSQGPLRQTGNPLDIAIDGKEFFVVETPKGERYTRNGSFQLNNVGELVTSEGYRVVGDRGPIVFRPDDKDIAINGDGTITVPNGTRGKLRLVTFEDPQNLQKDGFSTFRAGDNQQAQQALRPHVVQGSIEMSNVKGVLEMTRLIEVSRAYTQTATLLQQHGDMRKSAIERLAEIPA